MRKNCVSVHNVDVKLKDLSYDDLVWLFNKYIQEHNSIPLTRDCNIKNNLPHSKIINSILKKEQITYNDFINQFGKFEHVRSSIDNYDVYLQKYKSISNDVGHGLNEKELCNNVYGLPSASWFVKYCPCDEVKSFNDFVIWAGFSTNKLKKDKDEIVASLYALESRLKRPITQADINKNNIGFSMIVINRIWGSLNNCKQDLGLLKTLPTQPKPFDYYKNIIDIFLDDITKSGKGFTTWDEIETKTGVDHKTFVKSFSTNETDFYKYLLSRGVCLNPNAFSYSAILPSGEFVRSSYEYTFSSYLESIGFSYKKHYDRDVMYKDFLPLSKQSRINCDYVFGDKYIEIAGLISNKNNNWETQVQNHYVQERYQKKMLIKQQLLKDNNKQYLFLFPEDFDDDTYIKKFHTFIGKE